MGKAFNRCVNGHGRVVTISNGNKYFHICYLKGKGIRGEIHTKKKTVVRKRSRK